MKDGKGEGCLGDEDVARHRLEGRAGGVGPALEVARHHDALAAVCKHCLRRAENMAGRCKSHVDVADPHTLAVFQRLLGGIGHILEAGPHDRQGLRRGQGGPMAGPCMVAMAVGDDRPRDSHRRVDVEIAGFAIEAAWRRIEPGPRIQGSGSESVGRH